MFFIEKIRHLKRDGLGNGDHSKNVYSTIFFNEKKNISKKLSIVHPFLKAGDVC